MSAIKVAEAFAARYDYDVHDVVVSESVEGGTYVARAKCNGFSLHEVSAVSFDDAMAKLLRRLTKPKSDDAVTSAWASWRSVAKPAGFYGVGGGKP